MVRSFGLWKVFQVKPPKNSRRLRLVNKKIFSWRKWSGNFKFRRQKRYQSGQYLDLINSFYMNSANRKMGLDFQILKIASGHAMNMLWIWTSQCWFGCFQPVESPFVEAMRNNHMHWIICQFLMFEFLFECVDSKYQHETVFCSCQPSLFAELLNLIAMKRSM